MDPENKQSEDCSLSTEFSEKFSDIIQETTKSSHKPAEVEDVASFLVSIYAKNPSARNFMDHVESLFYQISNNMGPSRHCTFPTMSSFQRLIIHRVADYFNMVHYLDSSSHVVVFKKANSIIPVPLRVLYENSIKAPEVKESPKLKMKILRNPRKEAHPNTKNLKETVKTPVRSLEERRESYMRARARIFGLPLEECNIGKHFNIGDVSVNSEQLTLNFDTEKSAEDIELQSKESSDVKLLFHKCISDAANKNVTEEELLVNAQDHHDLSLESTAKDSISVCHGSQVIASCDLLPQNHSFSDVLNPYYNYEEQPPSLNFEHSNDLKKKQNGKQHSYGPQI